MNSKIYEKLELYRGRTRFTVSRDSIEENLLNKAKFLVVTEDTNHDCRSPIEQVVRYTSE